MGQKSSSLQHWSWGTIISVYTALGTVLAQYNDIHQRINIPKPHVDFKDEENTFFMRFWSDVARTNKQIKSLDAEIARRNKLIGVIG